MNYFDFFEIPVQFLIDDKSLRKKFIMNSKKYHPDHHAHLDEIDQQAILEKSILNNEAYKVLSDFERRIKYILELKSLIGSSHKNEMPQEFLMEMMDLNESIMELSFEKDPDQEKILLEQIETQQAALYDNVKSYLIHYKEGNEESKYLQEILSYYLKNRYLLRMKQNLTNTLDI